MKDMHLLRKTPAERQLLIEFALAAMTPERREAVAAKLKNLPADMQMGYLKALGGKSRTAAIKANCLDCVCWVRAEVTKCPMLACPFWTYRPFQKQEATP